MYLILRWIEVEVVSEVKQMTWNMYVYMNDNIYTCSCACIYEDMYKCMNVLLNICIWY
jgi:hypothetical protein